MQERVAAVPAWASVRERVAAVPAWAALGLLVLGSTGLRYWAASRVPTPWIAPDELIYAELGRSLWGSGSFEILGQKQHFYSLVYPALVGLPLRMSDLALGYALLKALQALVMSLAAVPVYLWGRSLVSRGWALVAAALALTIPGLAYSGLIMTEVAFYPLMLVAAWAMARALARPTLVNQTAVVAAAVAVGATRLQALVLVPVFVTALVLLALFERSPRRALRLWPALAGLGAAAGGWAAWRLAGGGPTSDLLGAYRAAGEVSYTVGDAALFARWHAADVVLFTGVVPACALLVLFLQALAGKERSPEARAYLAVAAALTAGLVVEVGIFASRHVGRLAERDLLPLAPVLFLAFALWLDRGAPRPRLQTALASVGAYLLLVSLPISKLVSLAAIPDAFTLIPLYRLTERAPGVDLETSVAALGAVAVLAFALLPGRVRWVLPLGLGLFLAAVSVSASRVVAAEATLVKQTTLGEDRRWIDEAADGPVIYLYSADVFWNSVWETRFWNRDVGRVYRLLDARVVSLTDLQHPSVGPHEDGRLVLADGSPARARYVVAPAALSFFGTQVDYAFAPALVLWRVEQPLRLAQRIQPSRYGVPLRRVRVLEYACAGGTLRLAIVSPTEQRIVVRHDGRPVRALRLQAGERWRGAIAALPREPLGKRLCVFDAVPQRQVVLERVEFVRPPA